MKLVTNPKNTQISIPLDEIIDAIKNFYGAHLNIKERFYMGKIWFKAYRAFDLINPGHKFQLTYRKRVVFSIGTHWFYQCVAFTRGYMAYPKYYKTDRKTDLNLMYPRFNLTPYSDIESISIQKATNPLNPDQVFDRIEELSK